MKISGSWISYLTNLNFVPKSRDCTFFLNVFETFKIIDLANISNIILLSGRKKFSSTLLRYSGWSKN